VGRPPSGGGAAPESSTALIARWPEGAGVEIVGLTRHPSDASSAWWRADGSPLTRPPCLVQKRALADQNDAAVYEIAWRFLSMDRESVRGTKARVPAGRGAADVRAYDEFGRPSMDYGVQAFLAAKEMQTTTVEFGMATGAWQTVLTTREGGETEQGDLGVIRIAPPEEIRSDTAVTVTMARAWTDKYAWRFFAAGVGGMPCEVRMMSRAAGEATSSAPEDYRFRVDRRSSEIKEFRVDVCPYHWLRFRNVSLRPGRDFGVQVESP